MSLSFTVHEMIFEKASASCREHSGYNLLDETAVRYGHPFTMVDVRCRGTVVRMGRRDGALFGTRTIRTLRGGSRCGGILIHLDGIRVSELAQGNIDSSRTRVGWELWRSIRVPRKSDPIPCDRLGVRRDLAVEPVVVVFVWQPGQITQRGPWPQTPPASKVAPCSWGIKEPLSTH